LKVFGYKPASDGDMTMKLRAGMRTLRAAALLMGLASLGATFGCGGANSPNRTPLAEKWLTRAKNSYRTGDLEDANHAATAALEASPSDPDIRLVNAKLALLRLDFARALKLTEGMTSSEAHGVRGRAHWYAGDLESAADSLEAFLRDPNVRDIWATDIAGLARRGIGRHPYAMDGSLVGAVEMPRAGSALIVPCEMEGEQILALVATANGEVLVDSNSRREPAWVNFTFNGVEVHDVPARTQDLSGLSRQIGAPVKALIGIDLLRHTHATFDRRGDQFVVRKNDPPAPPAASRVPLWYEPNGGLMMRATLNTKDDGGTLLLVDSSQAYLLALSDPSWKKAGVDMRTLRPEPELPGMKSGPLPVFRIGTFDLPMLPAVQGGPSEAQKRAIDMELGGVLGAGLIAAFRVTLGDDGRFAWLEPDPSISPNNMREPEQRSGPTPAAPPGALGVPVPADLHPDPPEGKDPKAPAKDPSKSEKPATNKAVPAAKEPKKTP
jgi:hypothetical protein